MLDLLFLKRKNNIAIQTLAQQFGCCVLSQPSTFFSVTPDFDLRTVNLSSIETSPDKELEIVVLGLILIGAACR
jgi:hypothetical protein